jgi:hypothetical protein
MKRPMLISGKDDKGTAHLFLGTTLHDFPQFNPVRCLATHEPLADATPVVRIIYHIKHVRLKGCTGPQQKRGVE